MSSRQSHQNPQIQLNPQKFFSYTKPQISKHHKRIKNELSSSRIQLQSITLRFDINMLLSLFNEMDSGEGIIDKRSAKNVFDTIGLYQTVNHLKENQYSFDHLLSILGEIQVPSEPSIYVLSFVKILTDYRNKCTLNDSEHGLEEAEEVQQKIKEITRKQAERQKQRIQIEHNKIYNQMNQSQDKQYQSFEEEWNMYINEFKKESFKKIHETRSLKKDKIIKEGNHMVESARKKNSHLMSPRLVELYETKKRLIDNRKYSYAIRVNEQIRQEKQKLEDQNQQNLDRLLKKKIGRLSRQNEKIINYEQENYKLNMNKLMTKKKEGENIMRVRMKNLKEEAQRKLTDHYKTEIHRLRTSFNMIMNH